MSSTDPQARVREIAAGESLRPFIRVAWRQNERDPAWVPPLLLAKKTLLDRRKHPFHQHADVAYFVAERGREVVGRVAAIDNRAYTEFHGELTGFFGLFECDDDLETARALLDAAAAWLRARGMQTMRGPFNFSTNDEYSSPGVLVEGFDTPPAVLMSHNPAYYGTLLERSGLHPCKDLLAYWLEGPEPPERLLRGAERLAKRAGVTVRSLEMRRFREEVAAIKSVYNSAWSRNWGFVPMTDAEFAFMAKELRPIVDPQLCLLVETAAGEPVGFSLALPDFNRALKKVPNGRLLPFGIFRLLVAKRRIDAARVITLGFKPGYQHLGLGALLYLRTWQIGVRHGYAQGEASWILDDNLDMRRPLENMGARQYKRYRIYERQL